MQAAGFPSPLTLEELDAILVDIARSDDRRSQSRVEHQKRVVVISLGVNRATVRSDVSLGWIEDVSASGAKLVLPHTVTARRIWVRMLGAGSRNPFIECRVQWTRRDSQNASTGPSDALQSLGVQFERQLTGQEFARLLAGMDGE